MKSWYLSSFTGFSQTLGGKQKSSGADPDPLYEPDPDPLYELDLDTCPGRKIRPKQKNRTK